MGKPRMLGYNKPFIPNRYADIRRRPAFMLRRLDCMEQRAEERKIEKIEKEVKAKKKPTKE